MQALNQGGTHSIIVWTLPPLSEVAQCLERGPGAPEVRAWLFYILILPFSSAFSQIGFSALLISSELHSILIFLNFDLNPVFLKNIYHWLVYCAYEHVKYLSAEFQIKLFKSIVMYKLFLRLILWLVIMIDPFIQSLYTDIYTCRYTDMENRSLLILLIHF